MTKKRYEPPPILEQIEDILNFIVTDLAYDADKLLDCHIGPPKCEMGRGPARFEIWENPGNVSSQIDSWPWGKKVYDYKGVEQDNCRECPHCGSTMFANAAIGQVIPCLRCGQTYAW